MEEPLYIACLHAHTTPGAFLPLGKQYGRTTGSKKYFTNDSPEVQVQSRAVGYQGSSWLPE